VTDTRVALNKGDLIRLSFALAGRPVVLTARWRAVPNKARNEISITTLMEPLSPGVIQDLEAASRGKIIAGVSFQVLQILGPACDLYSLGTIGVRMLLVNQQRSIGETIDDVKSLAAVVGDEKSSGKPLADRIGARIKSDAALRSHMGPHRLLWQETSPAVIAGAVPDLLWRRLLALLVRAQVGYPDSDCADVSQGAGPNESVTAALKAWRQELYTLACEARGLVFRSIGADQEIAGLLRKRLAQTGDMV